MTKEMYSELLKGTLEELADTFRAAARDELHRAERARARDDSADDIYHSIKAKTFVYCVSKVEEKFKELGIKQ